MKRLFCVLLFAAVFCTSCKNPVDNISVNIDGNVIHYKTTLILNDVTGASLPATLKVTVTGEDSAYVYDYAGYKEIAITNGLITLGIHPDHQPTAEQEVKFNVTISGTGYLTRIIPVSVNESEYSQVLNIPMLKVATPSAAVSLRTKSTAITAGKLTKADTLTTALTATIKERTTVSILAATEFKSITGTLIKATPLVETLIHYNPQHTDFVGLFPGATLSSNKVLGADGKIGTAFLIPAGFASASLTIGAEVVNEVTLPLAVNLEINPNYKPIATGQTVKLGDQLQVYHYNYLTGIWTYETVGTVARDSYGKLAVKFTSLHPGGFFVGDVLPTLACKTTSIKLIAPWLASGKQPMNITVYTADGLTKLLSKMAQVSDGLTETLSDLPAVAMVYKVSTVTTNEVLAEGNIINPCLGEQLMATLNAPAGTADHVTITVSVNCTGKGEITPPNFDLFYKVSSSSAAFQLLGTVENGKLSTTLLKIGTTYDFRVNWGTETKTVKSRSITSADNATSTSPGQALSIQACGVN